MTGVQTCALPIYESGYFNLVDSPEEADYAIVFVYPKSGNYFSATPGLLELDLCENKTNKAIDGSEYVETTVSRIDEINNIATKVHQHGGKLIVSVNSTMPWLLGNVEPQADALIASFETFVEAQLDVLVGEFKPVGKLPFTFPKSEEVIAVDENGVCISPNDVPGYDKDKYMPENMTYAYEDTDGNVYRLGYGLRY